MLLPRGARRPAWSCAGRAHDRGSHLSSRCAPALGQLVPTRARRNPPSPGGAPARARADGGARIVPVYRGPARPGRARGALSRARSLATSWLQPSAFTGPRRRNRCASSHGLRWRGPGRLPAGSRRWLLTERSLARRRGASPSPSSSAIAAGGRDQATASTAGSWKGSSAHLAEVQASQCPSWSCAAGFLFRLFCRAPRVFHRTSSKSWSGPHPGKSPATSMTHPARSGSSGTNLVSRAEGSTWSSSPRVRPR